MIPPLQFAGWEWVVAGARDRRRRGAGWPFHRAALRRTSATAPPRWTRWSRSGPSPRYAWSARRASRRASGDDATSRSPRASPCSSSPGGTSRPGPSGGPGPPCGPCWSWAPRTSPCCATASRRRVPVDGARGRRRFVVRPGEKVADRRRRRGAAPRPSTLDAHRRERARSRSVRATPVTAPPSTPAAGWSCGPRGSAPTPRWRRSRRLVERGPDRQGAGAATGRPGVGRLRAGRLVLALATLAGWLLAVGDVAEAVHRGRRRADHRLPVRARPGDADRAAGRHRPRRPARHPDPGARGARVDPAVDTDRARQDRHRHDRAHGAGRRRHRDGARPTPRLLRLAGAVEHAIRAPDRPRRSPRAPQARGRRAARRRRVRQRRRARGAGRRRRPRASWSGARRCWPSRASTLARALGRRGAQAAARGGRTVVAVGWDGAARGRVRRRRHGEAHQRRGGRAAARARPAPGAADRRQRRAARRRWPTQVGIDEVVAEVLPAGQGRRRRAAAGRRPRGRHGRRRRQRRRRAGRRPTSAWPWAPAPTPPSRRAT